jgi:hypothetical protein
VFVMVAMRELPMDRSHKDAITRRKRRRVKTVLLLRRVDKRESLGLWGSNEEREKERVNKKIPPRLCW